MKNYKSIPTLLLVVALLASCSGKNDKKGNKMNDEVPLVQVQSVFAENVDETSEYTATVEAFKTNYITSNSGNRIKRILVDVGSRVGAGQTLVILDNVTSVNQESAIAGQRASVANQGASLASQEAALKTEEINLARQKKDLDRAKELVRIGGGTQQAVDQLQAAYDAAQESLKARKRALEASRSSLQASQSSLGASQRSMQTVQENTVLRSPISGVVSARNYDPGDLPGGPILTIQQLNPLKVVVNVNEEEFPKIKVGMSVSVNFDVVPGETFTGTVNLIHPQVDQATRTFKVEVTLGNGGGKISTGMFARVKFNYGTENHIVVPDRAVVKMQGAGIRYVYVYDENGTVRYVEVKLGKRLGDRYEILSGLSNGDKVVVAGQSRLTDGAKVKLQEKQEAKEE
ncbi:MAG: efflux RND transporter periplasmic adaptor subunit [Muribaculaceae bacterium]|nr:efflux RND transporter periplasmic adaptor subunit [Muribaculaceae bacterium]